MSSNYPPGTGPNDPRAPWNQPDPKMIECPDCDGWGFIEVDDGVDERGSEETPTQACETCDGEGEIEDDGSDDEWVEEFF